jgi:hypothetical protein
MVTLRQWAVVTGASSGIGLELARQFAEHDFDLLIAAEDPGIEKAASELRSAGSDVRVLHVDLASEDGVRHLADASRGSGPGGLRRRDQRRRRRLRLVHENRARRPSPARRPERAGRGTAGACSAPEDDRVALRTSPLHVVDRRDDARTVRADLQRVESVPAVLRGGAARRAEGRGSHCHGLDAQARPIRTSSSARTSRTPSSDR